MESQWNDHNPSMDPVRRPVFTVVFEDDGGTVVSSRTYHVLERIEAPAIGKADDKHYRYIFKKWTPDLEEYATHDAVYRPVFQRKRKLGGAAIALCAVALVAVCVLAAWLRKPGDAAGEASPAAPVSAEEADTASEPVVSIQEEAHPEAVPEEPVPTESAPEEPAPMETVLEEPAPTEDAPEEPVPEESASDAEEQAEAENARRYAEAVELYGAGEYMEAARAFLSLGDYADSTAWACLLWDAITGRDTIGAGYTAAVAARSNGTVQCSRSAAKDWSNVVAVAARDDYAVGVNADGTIVTTDDSYDTSDWTNMVAVGAGSYHILGVCADGTVRASGSNKYGQCNVEDWTDVIAAAGAWSHTLGLRSDGTVLAAGLQGGGYCDVSDWHDIVAVAAGNTYSIGLRADGTVAAVGYEVQSQSMAADWVQDWTDIVAIASGETHIVGLRADGTVVTAGDNYSGRCDVSDWTDIVAISAGGLYTIGLRSDGTLVAAGKTDILGDLANWRGIRIPNRELYGLEAVLLEE